MTDKKNNCTPSTEECTKEMEKIYQKCLEYNLPSMEKFLGKFSKEQIECLKLFFAEGWIKGMEYGADVAFKAIGDKANI